ncbi:MAG: OmpA family protein [Chitinophagales bacterium]|nr:OmpA family protein [Chitinophagales bacterium]
MFLGLTIFSQTEERPNQIGLSLSAIDFSGPQSNNFTKFENFHGVGRLFYSRYLNNSLNVKADFSAKKVLHPKETEYPDIVDGVYHLEDLYDLGLKIEFKLDNGYIFKSEGVLGPYLTSGFGVNLLGGDETPQDWNTYIPFGLGFNIRPSKKITINLQGEYKLNIDNSFDYTQFSAGLAYNFGNARQKDVPVVDTDKDGIPDDSDECPFAYGIIDFDGCPDTDGDGIGDSRDRCPFDAGKPENKGCPILDKDGDGVPDRSDKCPDLPGNKSLQGCPDSDNDGIADNMDNCPDIAGSIENNGCPIDDSSSKSSFEESSSEVKNVYSIYFKGASDVILPDQTEVLDEVANKVKNSPTYKVKINGYTSAVGNDSRNMDLSLKRAENAWKYLVNKGVDGGKMAIYGFGEYELKYTDPSQQEKNRRVDLVIFE